MPQDPVRFKSKQQAAPEARKNRRAGVALTSQANGIVAREGKATSSAAWVGVKGREGPTIQSPLPSTSTGYNVRAFGIPVWGFKEKEGGKRKPALSTLPKAQVAGGGS